MSASLCSLLGQQTIKYFKKKNSKILFQSFIVDKNMSCMGCNIKYTCSYMQVGSISEIHVLLIICISFIGFDVIVDTFVVTIKKYKSVLTICYV